MSPTTVPNRYASHSLAKLADCADKTTWFHAVDCGEFQTSGRFQPGTPQNRTLYGVFDLIRQADLHGQRFLDLGTADGLLAFGAQKLGADVTAADTYHLNTFDLVRTALGLEIDYRPHLQIKDLLATFQPASFDFIACAGIIYHMLNPFSALLVGRQLVKEGGYFLIETAYAPGDDSASLVFNPEAEINPEINTYWLPTRRALEGMFRTASFEVVATRTIKNMPRITVLGRAVKPAEVPDRTALLQKIHNVDFCDHEFRLEPLFAEPRAASTITMAPVEAYEDIDCDKWAGNYPYHPRTFPNAKGRTRWSTPDGNNS